jgi:drug/metabolite transporter (DMT)-like permease
VRATGGFGTLAMPEWRLVLLRGAVMFATYLCYYLAIAALPLPTTVALSFAAPLFITLLSLLVLGEAVSRLQWLALAGGFAGVIVTMRPGSELFSWAAVLPVVSALGYAVSMIMVRGLGPRVTAAAMAFHANLVFLACALGLAAVFGTGRFDPGDDPSLGFLLRGWVMPTPADLALMLATGAIAAAGLVLLGQAYRIAAASRVAPFEYASILWSVGLGWLFWGHWPDPTGWAGIAIIVAAGLLVVRRPPVPRPAAPQIATE